MSTLVCDSPEAKEMIHKTKELISAFMHDLLQEGILKKGSITDYKDYKEFLEEWVKAYCVDELGKRCMSYMC
jgi:hypothetical protein